MAATTTQRSYVMCCAGINAFRLCYRVFFSRDSFHNFQPFTNYGTRGADRDTELYIPVERLKTSYSRSSGPGGQHVNKVNTKAEVRFHVLTADWIPEDVRQKITENNKNIINKAGELLVTSERSRSQHRNLTDCIEKIKAIIAEASQKPYEPTEEALAVRAARLNQQNKERLRKKKKNSEIKQSRRVEFD